MPTLIAILRGLWMLIQALPAFLQLSKEIIKFLHELEDYKERKARLEETEAAIRKARVERDTSKLDELFNGPPTDQPQAGSDEPKDAKSA